MCNLYDIDAIWSAREIEKITIVKIDKNSGYLIPILKANASPKTTRFNTIEIVGISYLTFDNISQTVHIFKSNYNEDTNNRQLEIDQLRLEHQFNIFRYALISYNAISKNHSFAPHELSSGHTSTWPQEIVWIK